jgi:hypothetical protein
MDFSVGLVDLEGIGHTTGVTKSLNFWYHECQFCDICHDSAPMVRPQLVPFQVKNSKWLISQVNEAMDNLDGLASVILTLSWPMGKNPCNLPLL